MRENDEQSVLADAADPRIAVLADNARRLELDQTLPAVLALSSQLVYGSVGLNAALPEYGKRDLRVAAFPTIVLSVMPHYPSVHDLEVGESWLSSALDDVVLAGALDHVRAIAVGYLAAPAQAQAIAEWYEKLAPDARPPLIVDPTLGDEELGFYTSPSVAEAIVDWLLPHAVGIVPNRFELAELTGARLESLTSEAECLAAARTLLATPEYAGLEWVVVTGIRNLENRTIGELTMVGDRVTQSSHPYIPSEAKGQGDTFTAALVSGILSGISLEEAVEGAAAAVRSRLTG